MSLFVYLSMFPPHNTAVRLLFAFFLLFFNCFPAIINETVPALCYLDPSCSLFLRGHDKFAATNQVKVRDVPHMYIWMSCGDTSSVI